MKFREGVYDTKVSGNGNVRFNKLHWLSLHENEVRFDIALYKLIRAHDPVTQGHEFAH